MRPAALSLVAALVAAAFTACGASAFAAEEIPVDGLREDFRVFRGALEESHVGLHWFVPKDELDRRFDELSVSLDRPMTAREFHRRLLPLVASLRHGHTTLELPVRGEGYRLRRLDKDGRYFPFEVRVLEGKLYVVTDLSEDAALGPGAELLSVEGRPARELLDVMRPLLSADGSNETFKTFQLGRGWRFHDLLDLLYGPCDAFDVESAPLAGGPPARRSVPAQTPARMAELYRERTGRGIDEFPPAFQFRLLGDGVALLTVASFYEGLIPPGEPGFPEFFASVFRQVKEAGVEDLIVDVRGNEGGNGSYVPLLYSYLADKPFRGPGARTVLSSASLSFLPYAENPSDDVKAFAADPEEFVTRAEDGSWVLNEKYDGDRSKEFEPNPDAFTGRLYVLTDGGAFSAANSFIEFVHRFHRREGRFVRFVGEQNGGDNAFARASGGQTLTVRLPSSGQRLGIPLLGGSRHFGPGAEAVIPDDAIVPSIRDVVGGVDRELEFVKESIAGSRER